MTLILKYKNDFKKNYKKTNLNKSEQDDFMFIVNSLLNQHTLDKKFKKHSLKGKLKDLTDIHIRSNLVLLVKITTDTLYLCNIGTHAEVLHL
ncbi:MAG: hypothetical protein Ta2D_03270 [Rickettsiales bacterium]|nr:MAG: hypothetical protein Ta2D_03270 [Rickettsiales bacterium]